MKDPSRLEAVVREVEKAQGKKKATSHSQADKLIRLATEEVTLWHDRRSEAFATLPDGRNVAVRHKAFRRWLLDRYYRAGGRGAPQNATQQALDTLDAIANFEGAEHAAFIRAARVDDSVYIDLADEERRAVGVDRDGWVIISLAACPVKLVSTDHMLPLPVPTKGGSIDDLWRLVNVPPDQRVRALVWLLSALGATSPYPVLAIEGCQDSAKSTLAKTLRCLVDPNAVDLRSPPSNVEDLAACANNAHVLAFDNVSYISPVMADAICRIATGGGHGARRYYTQDEEVLIEMIRPVILNGISSLLTRSDLASRSLLVRLPQIEEQKRLTERKYWRHFDAIKAGVLGALVDAMVYGLAHPTTLRRLSRMADAASWAISCSPALGYDPAEFAEAIENNTREVLQQAIEGDLFLDTLRDLIQRRRTWRGTAALLDHELQVSADLVNRPKPPGWPESPRGVTSKLERSKESLTAWGITTSRPDTLSDGCRDWIIQLKDEHTTDEEPPF